MVKPGRKILFTAVGIGGAILVVSSLNQRFNILGTASGGVEGIAKFIGNIPGLVAKNVASGAAEALGDAGNEFSEIQKNFENFFNPLPPAFGEPENPVVNTTSPNASGAGFNFAETLKSFGLGTNEIFTFNNAKTIGTRRNVGASITGGRGIVSIADAPGIRGKILPVNAVGRRTQTLQGTITTAAGGTRSISGSPALFARIQRNLGN